MTQRVEHSGSALHREYQLAFEERDQQALLNLIAEDAQWHVFGDSAFAGTVRGREAIWETFFAPQRDTPRQLEIHDVLGKGEHVVALGEVAFPGANGEVRFKTVEVYHHEDGLLTARWFFVDRRQELDRLLDVIASDGQRPRNPSIAAALHSHSRLPDRRDQPLVQPSGAGATASPVQARRSGVAVLRIC